MSARLARQAVAASELKKMPQPSEFGPGAETAAMLEGDPAAMVKDMKIEFDVARDTKAQQVACLEAYTAALAEIDDTTPSFGPDSLGLMPIAPVAGRDLPGAGTAASSAGEPAPGPAVTAASVNRNVGAGTVQPQSQGVVPQSGMIGGHLPLATPMGGVGAVGGAGARQDEEQEHTHASFLIDPATDDTSGAAVATPPPVLGAWGPDDDEER
ncbi:hypothetical protein BAY61_28965 [Prauserella marina]|uniref:Uncharacterized protein n=1 Tax=Prauserella marina TaxID=530584 RepID=A0A222VWV2_9PSEU|nr:hypothetical protein [Prauserella marina]ASR38370.1 hypothetical protein BAY61_28965 [Prauserella marina]PWV78411.1 hypothetical protein DES30_104145 [Prauserella marina]SDC85383.1 hypothetical protein SAMN05421630_104145 [Prauserella marina]